MCPGEIHLLLLQYGSEWRKQRRIVQSLLNVKVVDQLLPIQSAEASQTMWQLATDPAGYYDHIRRYTTAVILASVYGVRGARFDSPNVQALYHAQDQFTAILETGATPPVDAFPLLKLIPEALAPWKRWARDVRAEQKSLYLRLLRETRARMEAGQGLDCFLRTMLEEQEKNDMDDEHLAYLAGNLASLPFSKSFETKDHITNYPLDGSRLRHVGLNATLLSPSHDQISRRVQKGPGGSRSGVRTRAVPYRRRH